MGKRTKPPGEVLREIRRAAGLRLTDVAGALECSVSYVSEVERGVKPMCTLLTPERVERLMQLFGLGDGDARLYEACIRSFAQHGGPWAAECAMQVFGWEKPAPKRA